MKKRIVQAILLFILATMACISGILLIPSITNFGEIILSFVISTLILIYTYYFLMVKNINHCKGSVLILLLIEMILLTAISIASIVGKFMNIVYLNDSHKIIGITLWIIGLIETIRHYYASEGYHLKFPMYRLIINLFLVTIGTWFIITNYLITTILIYLVSAILFVISMIFIIKGILKITNKTNEIPYEILKD